METGQNRQSDTISPLIVVIQLELLRYISGLSSLDFSHDWSSTRPSGAEETTAVLPSELLANGFFTERIKQIDSHAPLRSSGLLTVVSNPQK